MKDEEEVNFQLFAEAWPFNPTNKDCKALAKVVERHGAALVLLALRSAVRTEASQSEDPMRRIVCEDFDRHLGKLIDKAVDAHHQIYNSEAWAAYLDGTRVKDKL
jgi:hypothetical protein